MINGIGAAKFKEKEKKWGAIGNNGLSQPLLLSIKIGKHKLYEINFQPQTSHPT